MRFRTIREGELPSNGALLRVLGGVLVGIGIGPVVVGLLTLPVEFVLGDVFAELFRPTVYFFATLLGVVVLHAVRLFYRGTWRSLEEDGRNRPSNAR